MGVESNDYGIINTETVFYNLLMLEIYGYGEYTEATKIESSPSLFHSKRLYNKMILVIRFLE